MAGITTSHYASHGVTLAYHEVRLTGKGVNDAGCSRGSVGKAVITARYCKGITCFLTLELIKMLESMLNLSS